MADVFDITPGLIERVDEYYRARCMANASLPRLAKKLEEGKATYDDAYKYAEAIGKARADAFAHEVSSDVLPDGRMYYNIADRLMTETLSADHEVVADYAAGVQELVNKRDGISLAAQVADLDEDRIKGFVEGICNADVYDDVAWKLGEPVVTHARTVVDDTVKKNAEFQGKAGVKATVIRNATSKCCEWCDDLAGDYTYPNVPREVFQRHDNCKCTVDYEGRRLTAYNSGGSSHSFRSYSEKERIDEREKLSERITNAFEQRKNTRDIIVKTEKAYNDIKTMFSTMQNDVKDLDKELLGENVERLKELNKRFNILNRSNQGKFTAEKGKEDSRAWTIAEYRRNANKYTLSLVKEKFQDANELARKLFSERDDHYKMPFADEYVRVYSITHEYGHMVEAHIAIRRTDWDALENKISRLVNPSADQIQAIYDSEEARQYGIIRDEILSIATKNNPNITLYGTLSDYGMESSAEFFAEVFANSQCGDPNELGRAMIEWLAREGF